MLTKNTKCKVSFETPNVWLKFLNDIFERKGKPEETEEIIHCIQKALGYCLTDSVKEQCMFILHGDGSNGKSTFIELICDVMGDYAITADSELLIQNKNSTGQSTQFSLASLKGSRLISTSETDEGKALAEARIKKMTGDNMVRAQHKFGKEFSYKTTYKIWMATNPKPIIRGTDHGIWRRMFYVPFENIFTEEKKDKSMPEKLRKELPQILGWMIQGYQMYKEEGLSKPKCLEEALADYKNQMNVINAYIKSECSDFPGFDTPARALYQDYKEWAKDNTEYCMSEGKFKEEMVKKGYKRIRRASGWFYIGIRMNKDKKGILFGNNDNE
jgi:putative DNA primase/helicase